MNKEQALENRNILITRAGQSAKKMAEYVESFGGTPFIAPVLTFNKRAVSRSDVLKALECDWLIFTSGTGVLFFWELLKDMSLTVPSPVKIAAVGRKTAEVLNRYHFEVDLIPPEYTAKNLAEALKILGEDLAITLIQGNLARDVLEMELIGQGHRIQTMIVYETVADLSSQSDIKKWVARSEIDAATFASPSALDFFLKISGLSPKDSFFEHTKIACIGPETRAHAIGLGLEVSIMPNTFTAKALIEAIAEYYMEGSSCTT